MFEVSAVQLVLAYDVHLAVCADLDLARRRLRGDCMFNGEGDELAFCVGASANEAVNVDAEATPCALGSELILNAAVAERSKEFYGCLGCRAASVSAANIFFDLPMLTARLSADVSAVLSRVEQRA